MVLYGLKNCETSRRAMKLLGDVTFVDVREDGVPDDVMRAALDRFGDALLNKRSTTWRGLDEAARERPVAELLKEHPALMKRPLIEGDDTLYLGWDAQTRADLGLE